MMIMTVLLFTPKILKGKYSGLAFYSRKRLRFTRWEQDNSNCLYRHLRKPAAPAGGCTPLFVG